MTRSKIDYGIDLGTTNSTIARMENGEPVIKKTDTLKDTMPSCVYINKKKAIQVGDSAYNAMKRDKLKAMKGFDSEMSNSFIEFKRTMGTEKKYHSSNMNKEFTSEELSAEVLKTLRSFITDENFKSVVITVPAKFTINQKDATTRAAKLAGFEHCELLQEPIAASMAYGLDSKSKNGYWLVFDFGGGTFDAALLKVEEGIMKVIDTEGDNYLGGKNLDYAIVDDIIIPHLQENFVIDSILEDVNKRQVLREAVKSYAEDTKIQMSFNDTYNILSDLGDVPGEDDEGEEFEIDITITQEMMQNTLGPIFQKAIDICKDLLKRNNLTNNEIDTLLLVGGPTHSKVLRKMLAEQICTPETSVDPMTVVSKGAALYASTKDISDEIKEQQRDKTKIQLEFGYEATTVEEEEFVTIKILKNKTEGLIPPNIFVDVVRADKAWSSGKTEIDEVGEVIEVKLNLGKPNAFNVLTYDEKGDLLASEPSSFTIIQGSKVGSATLPYNIGINILDLVTKKEKVTAIKGLEKNTSYTATGVKAGLKTQKDIRPGIAEDIIKVSVFELEHDAEGSRPIFNEKVFNAVITGEDLPAFLPEGSDVDITIKCIGDGDITLSAFFPALEHTHEIKYESVTSDKVDTTWIEIEIKKAKQTIKLIQQEGMYADHDELNTLNKEITEIQKRFEQGKGDYDSEKDVLDSLRRSLRKLDKIEATNEWPKIEEELKQVFYRLEETNQKYGNEKTTNLVNQFRDQIEQVIENKNVKVAQEMIDNIRSLDFALVDQGIGVQMEISYLKHFNDEFDVLDWKDRNRARMTLERGLQLAANNPTKEKLRPVIIELFKLLPETDKPIIGGGDGSELVG